jgi:hypothetical protein
MSPLSFPALLLLAVIAIPVFFILRRIAAKTIKKETARLYATLAATVIITPLLYFGAIFIFFSVLFHTSASKFSSKAWQADTARRFTMAGDIIKSNLLTRKDSSEVKALLGDTPRKYEDGAGQRRWVYDMGQGGGGLGWLFHSLEVNFCNNRVSLVVHNKVKD